MFDAQPNRPYTQFMVRRDELLGSRHEAQARSGRNGLSPGDGTLHDLVDCARIRVSSRRGELDPSSRIAPLKLSAVRVELAV